MRFMYYMPIRWNALAGNAWQCCTNTECTNAECTKLVLLTPNDLTEIVINSGLANSHRIDDSALCLGCLPSAPSAYTKQYDGRMMLLRSSR